MDIKEYNPSAVGTANGNYFGMPFTAEESALVLVSVPWGVTASYGGGQEEGPDAIIGASVQLDFYDEVSPNEWRKGIGTVPIDYSIQDRSKLLRGEARRVIEFLEKGGDVERNGRMAARLGRVNTASAELNREVYECTAEWLAKGKLVGLVGGDHSVPLGYIKALGEKYGPLGVLHIDAHCDLREAYEGFTYSHASIMYNVLQEVPQVERLVQVGIRDYCDEEVALAESEERVVQFSDHSLATAKFEGTTWAAQCEKIVSSLPQRVYVSFDIDGLSPDNCPHTGTPVPGGLGFNEAVYLLDSVVRSGRRIVGFDLVEVAPSGEGDEWDANVGARMLFKLCGLILKSN
ncbi:MAG: agmatinase family protein [Tidjanibacter sp.]|nr:agmatinase family protein [Tidjanibacter sp.]MBQ3070662.1 agmatinase family protein [Tidjanibacter sp.]